jgi:hypothetical protein
MFPENRVSRFPAGTGKLVPVLIKHNAMEAFGKIEAQLHTRLNSALVAGD